MEKEKEKERVVILEVHHNIWKYAFVIAGKCEKRKIYTFNNPYRYKSGSEAYVVHIKDKLYFVEETFFREYLQLYFVVVMVLIFEILWIIL